MAHVIGLTGGIASGKSTVAKLLAARGAAVVDADLLARQVVEPGQPALSELIARFGAAILTPEGTLDRKRLGAIAFADPAARADLQRITHPRIAAASAAAIAAWSDAGAAVVFYEAALLVENGTHRGLAGLVVVAAAPAVQRARVMARDGLDPAAADARLAAQAPLADKLAAATWVIQNDGVEADLAAAVDRVVAAIEAKHGVIRVPAKRARRATATNPAGGPDAAHLALVTGFPSPVVAKLVAKLAAEPATRVQVLVAATLVPEAERALAGIANAQILVGDVADMDLGLSTAEYRALARDATWIYHSVPEGLDTILDLARDAARLERLVYQSTVFVSGTRVGTIYEEDLESGQRFTKPRHRAHFDAERRLRAAMRDLPITILRPGMLLESRRDSFAEMVRIVATNTTGLALPLPGHGAAPLHLVPVDYVVDAGWIVTHAPNSAGQTYHLVDPAPLAANRVLQLVAERAQTLPPRWAGPLARALLRAPLLSRFSVVPRALADLFDHVVHYDQTNTARALSGTTLRCPSPSDYLPALVDQLLATKRSGRIEVSPEDPADPLA